MVDNERLCAMEVRLRGLESSPRAGSEFGPQDQKASA